MPELINVIEPDVHIKCINLPVKSGHDLQLEMYYTTTGKGITVEGETYIQLHETNHFHLFNRKYFGEPLHITFNYISEECDMAHTVQFY